MPTIEENIATQQAAEQQDRLVAGPPPETPLWNPGSTTAVAGTVHSEGTVAGVPVVVAAPALDALAAELVEIYKHDGQVAMQARIYEVSGDLTAAERDELGMKLRARLVAAGVTTAVVVIPAFPLRMAAPTAGGEWEGFKAWVRHEVELARAGHSLESRVISNP